MARGGVEYKCHSMWTLKLLQLRGVKGSAMQGGGVKWQVRGINWKPCKDHYIKETLEEKFSKPLESMSNFNCKNSQTES